jgi:hypothetical protein
MITVQCPQCSRRLDFDASIRGLVVKCSDCDKAFQVPKDAPGEPPPEDDPALLAIIAEEELRQARTHRWPFWRSILNLAIAGGLFMLFMTFVRVYMQDPPGSKSRDQGRMFAAGVFLVAGTFGLTGLLNCAYSVSAALAAYRLSKNPKISFPASPEEAARQFCVSVQPKDLPYLPAFHRAWLALSPADRSEYRDFNQFVVLWSHRGQGFFGRGWQLVRVAVEAESRVSVHYSYKPPSENSKTESGVREVSVVCDGNYWFVVRPIVTEHKAT